MAYEDSTTELLMVYSVSTLEFVTNLRYTIPEGDELLFGGFIEFTEKTNEDSKNRELSQIVIVTKNSIRVINTE